MDYRRLARELNITDLPPLIDYWPEKEIHHLATLYRGLVTPRRDDPRRVQAQKDIDQLVEQQEAKAKLYYDHLTEEATKQVGTLQDFAIWTQVPDQFECLWSQEAYSHYEELWWRYTNYYHSTPDGLAGRIRIGRMLQHIREDQEGRVNRLSETDQERNLEIRRAFVGTRWRAGQAPPTDAELSEAYSTMDVVGTYEFPPGRQVRMPTSWSLDTPEEEDDDL
jgi:hypothetical protein